MNQPVTYALRRNVPSTDKNGRSALICLAVIRMPDGSGKTLAIPEGLLATIPPDKREDFIAAEIESVVGYEVTRRQ